ncbi:MAG: GLUG motif-containing protein, partial [Prevotella sp.]|nr:GLUG motif-containing protein [Prevotella sp.]
MRQKISLLFALLWAVAQGAWAQNYDVWDGTTTTQPSYSDHAIQINTAAQMAWLMKNYTAGSVYIPYSDGSGRGMWDTPRLYNISINADFDMTAANWARLIGHSGNSTEHYGVNGGYCFPVTCNGNGHTIKIKISDVNDNYQGLFYGIGEEATVKNLHVVADIHCAKSRLVGGIVGENNGTIENCWVSGTVRSDWKEPSSAYTAKVGGIAGENNGTIQYCCVTANVQNDDADVGGLVGCNDGTLQHCTFYGERSSTHDQASIYSGNSANWENCYGVFNQGEYDAASGKDLYRYAIKYPYTCTVKTEGTGTIRTKSADEYDVPGVQPSATFTLNVTSGSMHSYTITDADGNDVALQGHADDWSSFWFVMPKRDVTATVDFWGDWPKQGEGTEASPYLISSADDWNNFAQNVKLGRSYSGSHVKLTADISVSHMAGGYLADDNYQPFSGTFDGDGHTLTINLNNQSRFAAPFKCVKDATIKNLRTAGTIDGTGNADGKLLAGLAGICFSSATITNCRSSVTLTTNFGEDAAMAGIVAGTKGGSLTIEGCVFDGTMTGSTNTRCAGIAGYEYIATTTVISNTLFAPTTLTVSTADDSYTKTFTRDPDATITNCYYTQPLGAAQGTEGDPYIIGTT